MQEQDKKELISSMRRKRLKKYALTALALVIVVSVAVSFKLEDRNAKLPDGQGEIVVNTDQTGENPDAQDGSGDADGAAQADGSGADAEGQDGSETAGGDIGRQALELRHRIPETDCTLSHSQMISLVIRKTFSVRSVRR